MTAEQYLQLGEDPPGVRLELVEGEIAVSPSVTPDHSFADRMLGTLLHRHVLAHDLGQLFGDVDTIVSRFTVRRPDLIFFSKARLDLVGEKAMEGPPDLCVEVISPGSEKIDRRDKFEQYRRFGVLNYWLVDYVERTFDAYALRDGEYVPAGHGTSEDVVSAPPFADLTIPLGQLWRKKR